jgi:Zn-dependent peptidase ImmA (M78 family)
MRLRPSEAERQARAVLAETHSDTLPIPVHAIAEKLGAKIQFEPMPDEISGLLYRDEDETPIVGVNSSHSNTRQRFTIAHEIGHLRLHASETFIDGIIKRDQRSERAVDPKEIQANGFAAELLMPAHMVLAEVRRLIDEKGPQEARTLAPKLAARFDVSPSAMEFRLANLGLATSF